MQKNRFENLLEKTNKPILVLAIVAIVLYALELFRVVPKPFLYSFLWLNLIIDCIFLLDLLFKCFVLGRSYLKSPWFFIDFLSTIPIISSALEVIGAMSPQLQAARVARGARVARIARITRVARLAKVGRVARLATAIRANQGLSFLKVDDGEEEYTPRFNRSLFIGVPILLLAFVIANSIITERAVNGLKGTITQEIENAQTIEDLASIEAKYDVNESFNPILENIVLTSSLDGGRDVPVSLQQAYKSADRLAGIMLLVLLITIGLSVFISSSLSRDRSIRRERLILRQCFSPPIVDRFYSTPEVVDRFYRHWMTVFFIDIRGFSKAVEKDSGDVEGLALKLRKVMDVARQQIVISHEGIIDKFMGDAVMGWVGGLFSVHWRLLEDVRKKLYIEELESVQQDIKSIKREVEKILQMESVDRVKLAEHTSALKEAEKQGEKWKKLQAEALKDDPELSEKHEEVMAEYRTKVAKSALTCCLRISQEVGKIDDPDGFNKLKIGVGSGEVLIGNFGATNQIAYTVLGPTVNRAARLEPASAQVGCEVLIDGNTYELLKDDSEFKFRRLPHIEVKGISLKKRTYEPFFADKITDQFLETFEKGVNAMEDGKTEAAMAAFNQSNQLREGGDVASQIWLNICKEAFEEGVEVGIRRMKK